MCLLSLRVQITRAQLRLWYLNPARLNEHDSLRTNGRFGRDTINRTPNLICKVYKVVAF